jgi:hypothetical protein
MAKQYASWVNIDAATLAPELFEAYIAYKNAYKVMKDARVAFEQSMGEAAELPGDKRMIFGYMYGKLSVAIVDNDKPVAKPKVASLSLAQFLAAQQQAGRAA